MVGWKKCLRASWMLGRSADSHPGDGKGLSVPFWIDMYWLRLFLTILALLSVRHKFLCVVQGRGWGEKMGVGAARRGQASACSTNTQIIHEDDQHQRYSPASGHLWAPNDPLWWCHMQNMFVRRGRDAARNTPNPRRETNIWWKRTEFTHHSYLRDAQLDS